MKKIILVLTGIAMIATATVFYSCNKEGNDVVTDGIVTEVAQTKTTGNGSTRFYPHFLFRDNMNTGWCKETGKHVCGSDILDPNNPYNNQNVMNGDELCLLMRYAGNPDDLFGMYLPFGVLYANNAGELIDSAENGAMTFHADFNIYSEEIAAFAGTDLIPAGRYSTTITEYNGKDMVYIYLGKIK